jgi:hypothetical protein
LVGGGGGLQPGGEGARRSNCRCSFTRHKQILGGLWIKALVCASVILAPLRGKAQLPIARLSTLFPPGGKAGTTVEVTVSGADLDDANQLHFSNTNISGQPKISEKTGEPEPNKFVVAIASSVPPGSYEARAIGRFGATNPRWFVVGDLPEINSPATDHTPESATEIPLGTVVNGRVNANAADYFRFSARKGQRVLIECLARDIDSRMDDTLILYDNGRELERQRRGGLLDFIAPADGQFVVAVSDSTFRGGEDYFYRLTIGAGPHIDYIFPPAGLPGTKGKYTLYGRNLPGSSPAPELFIGGKPLEQLPVEIELPADSAAPQCSPAGLGLKPAEAVLDGIEYRLHTPQGDSAPALLSFATATVVTEREPNNEPGAAQKIPLPCEFVGQFYPAGDRDWLTFEAKKGDVCWIEVFSHRLGLPTAPFVLLQRVDKNDRGEEKVSDVRELYASDANIGGAEFNTITRDPSARFEVKEDGVYRIRVNDLFNRYDSSPRFVYRLSLRKETPDFRLVALPQAPPPLNKDAKEAMLWTPLVRRGETIPLKVLAFRRDSFNGEIQLAVEGLPPGVVCAPAKIPSDKSSGLLFITATEDAGTWFGAIQAVGKTKIAESEVTRVARAGSVTWSVPDYNNEPVRPRLTREVFLSISGAETAPIIIEPAENKIWNAVAGGKLQIPFKLTRRGEFNEALKFKAMGAAALDGLTELEVQSKTNATTLEVDLGKHKLSPGNYTFYLQAQTKGSYRNNPEAAKKADDEAKQAEKLAAESSAENKTAADILAEASKTAEDANTQARAAAEKFAATKSAASTTGANAELIDARDAAEKESDAAAEKARLAAEAKAVAAKSAEDASAKVREAEAKKTAAANRAKAAEERAKPRDVTVTVYSKPVTIQVNAEEKKP